MRNISPKMYVRKNPGTQSQLIPSEDGVRPRHVLRKMGFDGDTSCGRWGARRLWRLLSADRAEGETLNTWCSSLLRLGQKEKQLLYATAFFLIMRKMGLEPTRRNRHKNLNLARLPIPTLPHSLFRVKLFAAHLRLCYNIKPQ